MMFLFDTLCLLPFTPLIWVIGVLYGIGYFERSIKHKQKNYQNQ